MNSGKYIFSQVVEFIPKYEFDKLVKLYKGDYHVRRFSTYNHLLHLLFGQLTVCSSLRDICLCFKAHQNSLYHLGVRQTVNASSLSRANEKRDYRIFEGLGQILIGIVRPLYAKENLPKLQELLDYEIFALDSTTISCSIKLLSWAFGKYSKGAVKMHTAIDLRGNIPSFILVTHGKYHDSNVLDEIEITSMSIYAMDKAYVDFAALARIDNCGAFFVTRAKDNMQYEILEQSGNIDESTGLRGGYTVKLTGTKSKNLYPKNMRLVTFYDAEKGEEFKFITNNQDISAIEVTDIYKNRWQIEVFFKWIKQNLTIKSLWGNSENAVKLHLWTAICAYLLVARIKANYQSPYSITECHTLISVSALAKINLKEMLMPESLSQNQNVKELDLFNFALEK